MKTLVFGRTGQVAIELQQFGGVVALDRVQADLTNPEACAAIVRSSDADVVINAAAFTAVDLAESSFDIAQVVNCDAPAAIARAAAVDGKPFVHISTDYVFPGIGDRPWREEDGPNPQNVYGKTKLSGEQAIQDVGGVFAVVRTSWVFSAHGKNFVKTMLQLGATRNQLSVVDDQFGAPTPARNIAATCLAIGSALREGRGKSGIYHYAGQPDTTWADFAREVFSQAGRSTVVEGVATSQFPTTAKRPANSRLDCTRIHDVFGIDRPDWRAALKDTLTELKVS